MTYAMIISSWDKSSIFICLVEDPFQKVEILLSSLSCIVKFNGLRPINLHPLHYVRMHISQVYFGSIMLNSVIVLTDSELPNSE